MPCSQDDCQLTPKWRPVLAIGTKRRGKPLEFRFTRLGYCDAHRDKAVVATVLSDEGFHKVAKHVRELGLGNLDRASATLKWEEIDSREAERMTDTQDSTVTDDTLPF